MDFNLHYHLKIIESVRFENKIINWRCRITIHYLLLLLLKEMNFIPLFSFILIGSLLLVRSYQCGYKWKNDHTNKWRIFNLFVWQTTTTKRWQLFRNEIFFFFLYFNVPPMMSDVQRILPYNCVFELGRQWKKKNNKNFLELLKLNILNLDIYIVKMCVDLSRFIWSGLCQSISYAYIYIPTYISKKFWYLECHENNGIYRYYYWDERKMCKLLYRTVVYMSVTQQMFMHCELLDINTKKPIKHMVLIKF